jgi:hypothetical protein
VFFAFLLTFLIFVFSARDLSQSLTHLDRKFITELHSCPWISPIYNLISFIIPGNCFMFLYFPCTLSLFFFFFGPVMQTISYCLRFNGCLFWLFFHSFSSFILLIITH